MIEALLILIALLLIQVCREIRSLHRSTSAIGMATVNGGSLKPWGNMKDLEPR